MSFDIATAKTLFNIPTADTSKDVVIRRAIDTVLALVETKLGRGILLKTVDETYYDVNFNEIRVFRYPIKTLIAINGMPVVVQQNYRVHHRVGRITALMGWGAQPNKVTIRYAGGFDPIPLDLEQALWEILQAYWGTISPTTGMPVSGGTSSSIISGSGDVSSISFGPFGTVRYDVGSTVVGGDSGAAAVASAEDQRYWGWLAPWIYVLQDYRSEMAPSVCFA